MSSSYEWTASKQVVERLVYVPSRGKQKLIDYFDHLASNPAQEPQWSFQNEEGREIFIIIFESWVITYSVDDAAKSLAILAVE